jgi:eukaryotic-like serine/threonine-protein kinase
MDLTSGTRLGPYEIVAAIGAGGMGEVYRARDTRLSRTVAIKVLSRQFSSDADRLMRFEREARTLASLNHPNIAQLYGTEQAGDTHALAMEFVDGDDLAHTLVRGPLPIDEAVAIARQIADALAAAHEHGVIHRDLKPANIKVRADGTVKVLDFGLAKTIEASRVMSATDAAATIGDATQHPTMTSPAMTQLGVILGTAAYMSPEQAKGKPVDRGSDLWSFGAVLYEMLVGRPAFAGETVTDVLAAIVTHEPDWTALPAGTPPAIRRLLRRCLERDRRRRLADAGEARFQLEEAASAVEPPAPAAAVTPSGVSRAARLVPWAIVALLAAAVSVLAVRLDRAPVPESAKYNLELPAKTRLSFASRPAVAVSEDGRTVVFVATVDGTDRLYVRHIDSFQATEIPGTENASSPAMSPDGRSVVFATSTRVAKVSLAGGPVTTLAETIEPRGLSWDGEAIVYSPNSVSGIWRVPAQGGRAEAVTTLAASERTHRYPQQLPNGAVLFTVGSDASPDNYDDAIVAVLMSDGSRHTVLTAASMARYVPPGHLFFARGGAVFVVPFDARTATVTGTPVEILQDVAGDLTTGAHHFAVAPSGPLVYISGRNAPGSTVPAWVRPTGGIERLALPAGGYGDLRISPDGEQLAGTVTTQGGSDIWIHHLRRQTITKVTSGGQNMTALWSRDGATLYYTRVDTGRIASTIMRRPADGSRQAEAIVTVPGRVYLNDVAPDDRSIVVSIFNDGHRSTTGVRNSWLARLPLEEHASPTRLADETNEFSGRVSPDGRWLAYVGRAPSREVYVRTLTGDGRWQVSTAGGEEPKWSRDGRHLYFRNDNMLMSVTINPRAAVFESTAPMPIVKGIYNLRNESGISYDVDVTDGRFLMLRLAEDAADALSLRVVTNWKRELP